MADPEQEPLESTVPLPAEVLPPVREPVEFRPVLVPEALPATTADVFPPWSGWEVAAVLCFTLAAVFLFSTVALGVAHVLTSKQHTSWSDLATNPIVVIGAQVAAYPIVIVFMTMLVRNKTRERFWAANRWNWPGPAILRFLIAGAAFAFAVEFASRWLPIPKSLPVDRFFTDTKGAYMMAALVSHWLRCWKNSSFVECCIRFCDDRLASGWRSCSRLLRSHLFMARNLDMHGRRCSVFS